MSAHRSRRERQYATKAKVRTFVETAHELGMNVSGFEVTPDGTIRILNERAIAVSREAKDAAFDKWFGEGA